MLSFEDLGEFRPANGSLLPNRRSSSFLSNFSAGKVIFFSICILDGDSCFVLDGESRFSLYTWLRLKLKMLVQFSVLALSANLIELG